LGPIIEWISPSRTSKPTPDKADTFPKYIFKSSVFSSMGPRRRDDIRPFSFEKKWV
jgi:hypothetical protein